MSNFCRHWSPTACPMSTPQDRVKSCSSKIYKIQFLHHARKTTKSCNLFSIFTCSEQLNLEKNLQPLRDLNTLTVQSLKNNPLIFVYPIQTNTDNYRIRKVLKLSQKGAIGLQLLKTRTENLFLSKPPNSSSQSLAHNLLRKRNHVRGPTLYSKQL